MDNRSIKKVLILCTGNSCRSIIAEALINAKLDGISSDSSGVKSSGRVNPNAQKLLEQKGIWKEEYHSKTIDKVIDNKYDLVITVCGNAQETCPMFPNATKVIHVGFEDPDGKGFDAFEDTYKEIEEELLPKVGGGFKLMKVLKIYDPAMCCPTGVCGTDVDTKLVQLANFLSTLAKDKFEVHRYGLSTEPAQYVSNQEVSRILKEEGVDSLPLFFVDDELVFSKDYPTVPSLSSKLGLASFVAKF